MPKVVTQQVEFEGHFFEQTVVIEGDDITPWGPEKEFSVVGQPHTRIDGSERVTGGAKFTHDIHLPGMLYGKFLRSPHPHAQIKKISTSRAEKLPGVRAIFTYENSPEIPWRMGLTKLFDKRIRYAGEEVACVIADDESICLDALDLIEVEYEKLPSVVDAELALENNAPKLHEAGNLVTGKPETYARGDVEKGFKEADVVVEGTFRTQVALHNCMETHGSAAVWEGDNLKIWDSTQHIFGVRDMVATALGLPKHKVRVIKQYMGGGFGSKNGAGKYTILAALAAKKTGRPVKILLDRREENLLAGNRPSTLQIVKIGATRDGKLTAIYHKCIANEGAYAAWVAGSTGPSTRMYACPNVKAENFGVFTNLGPVAAFRAPGYVEGTFALEAMMDEVAAKLGIDPLELRLRNYAEVDPTSGKSFTTKGLRKAYEIGSEMIGWERRSQIKKQNSTATKKIGFGMGSQIWGGSGGPPAYSVVKINNDGTAVVLTGTQEIGTGAKTAMAQIAAEVLAFPIESISVELGDTQIGLYSPLSAGSMTLASVGPAVRGAAEDAKKQLLDVGSQVLNIPIEDLVIENGDFLNKKSGERTPVKKIYEKLQNYMIVGRGARGPNPADKVVNTFGAQFAQVEVDIETGKVTLQKIVAVHESGRVINPLATRSQLEGGIIQGLGFALCEQRFVDPHLGLVLNASLETYKIPTMMDIPAIEAEMVNMPDPDVNNLGVKGIGEPPIIPTPAAIANAVADALGKRIYELPLSADRVLNTLYPSSQNERSS
ncbi:xanthine dehydrogenase family protein molybdopterin-binding subunit [Candidatus Acetothermia bacterium]|nr:xanthine dehydrogenase family protein molybdopterin-binding subunit [Candidatus Acetothermia bacterium]MBI3643007.1 xanthine dehydrogenase family protein molybdopterin-binding subunit [Candidatus Acetothermia bacterium]